MLKIDLEAISGFLHDIELTHFETDTLFSLLTEMFDHNNPDYLEDIVKLTSNEADIMENLPFDDFISQIQNILDFKKVKTLGKMISANYRLNSKIQEIIFEKLIS